VLCVLNNDAIGTKVVGIGNRLRWMITISVASARLIAVTSIDVEKPPAACGRVVPFGQTPGGRGVRNQQIDIS